MLIICSQGGVRTSSFILLQSLSRLKRDVNYLYVELQGKNFFLYSTSVSVPLKNKCKLVVPGAALRVASVA